MATAIDKLSAAYYRACSKHVRHLLSFHQSLTQTLRDQVAADVENGTEYEDDLYAQLEVAGIECNRPAPTQAHNSTANNIPEAALELQEKIDRIVEDVEANEPFIKGTEHNIHLDMLYGQHNSFEGSDDDYIEDPVKHQPRRAKRPKQKRSRRVPPGQPTICSPAPHAGSNVASARMTFTTVQLCQEFSSRQPDDAATLEAGVDINVLLRSTGTLSAPRTTRRARRNDDARQASQQPLSAVDLDGILQRTLQKSQGRDPTFDDFSIEGLPFLGYNQLTKSMLNFFCWFCKCNASSKGEYFAGAHGVWIHMKFMHHKYFQKVIGLDHNKLEKDLSTLLLKVILPHCTEIVDPATVAQWIQHGPPVNHKKCYDPKLKYEPPPSPTWVTRGHGKIPEETDDETEDVDEVIDEVVTTVNHSEDIEAANDIEQATSGPKRKNNTGLVPQAASSKDSREAVPAKVTGRAKIARQLSQPSQNLRLAIAKNRGWPASIVSSEMSFTTGAQAAAAMAPITGYTASLAQPNWHGTETPALSGTQSPARDVIVVRVAGIGELEDADSGVDPADEVVQQDHLSDADFELARLSRYGRSYDTHHLRQCPAIVKVEDKLYLMSCLVEDCKKNANQAGEIYETFSDLLEHVMNDHEEVWQDAGEDVELILYGCLKEVPLEYVLRVVNGTTKVPVVSKAAHIETVKTNAEKVKKVEKGRKRKVASASSDEGSGNTSTRSGNKLSRRH